MKPMYSHLIRLAIVALVAAALTLGFTAPTATRAQQTQQKPKQDPKPPQDPQKKPDEEETIKIGTQLVNVLFTIQDKQNRYLNDLKKEDIEILENGQPQEIFAFKRELDLPLTMAILVDVSGSEQYTLPLLKDAGARFVDSVVRSGKDTVGVVKFEGEATVMQNLTSNPARVRKALEEIAYNAPPPAGVFGGTTPPINGGSRQGYTSLWDSVVATCVDMLAKEPGRKTIILLTDGVDSSSHLKIGDAITEALRAEVVIYAIGIADPGFGGVDEGKLKQLCESTGGRAVIPKGHRDLDAAFAQLEQDLRQQYLLAYEPKNEASDGTFRKLEVRLAGRKDKDTRIRHRKGYYAPKN